MAKYPYFKTLDEFLKSCYPDSEVKEIHYEDSSLEGLVKTQGMASSSGAATVSFENSKIEDAMIFIKICRKGSQADVFNQMLHTFDKEVSFYKDILPELVNFEKLKYHDKASHIAKYIPKFIGAGYVDEDFCFVRTYCFSVKIIILMRTFSGAGGHYVPRLYRNKERRFHDLASNPNVYGGHCSDPCCWILYGS